MGISSRSGNNISLLGKAKAKMGINPVGRVLIEEKMDSRYLDYLNCYSLTDLLGNDAGEDNYRQLAREVMTEIMALDFSKLPFQTDFPLKGFLENHTIFNTSSIPSFLYPDEKHLMRSYVGASAVGRAIHELKEPFTQELLDSVLGKIPVKDIERMMEEREKFMVDLEQENSLLLEYLGYFADDWKNDGNVHVADIKKLTETWNSYFNSQTGFEDQPLVDSLTALFANLNKIGDGIQERYPDADPAELGVKMTVVKAAFAKGNWDVDAVGQTLEYFVPKFVVKQQEIEHARRKGLGLGQINYAGGTYSPGSAFMDINFVNQLRRDVMDGGETNDNFFVNSDEIARQFHDNFQLHANVLQTVVSTILHEYAHMVSMSPRRDKLGIPFGTWYEVHDATTDADFCSKYAHTNPSEHYAEAFARYWSDVLLSNELKRPSKSIAPFIGL